MSPGSQGVHNRGVPLFIKLLKTQIIVYHVGEVHIRFFETMYRTILG